MILGPYASSLGPTALGSKTRRRRASSSLSHRPMDLRNRYPRRRASPRTSAARARFFSAAPADAPAPPGRPAHPWRYIQVVALFPSRFVRASTPNAARLRSYMSATRLPKGFTANPNARATSGTHTPASPAAAHSDTRLSSTRVSSCIDFPPTGFRRGSLAETPRASSPREPSSASSVSGAPRRLGLGADSAPASVADVRRNASIVTSLVLPVFASVTVVCALAHAATPRWTSHSRARANSLFIFAGTLVSRADHWNAPLSLRSVSSSTRASCLSVITPCVAVERSSADRSASARTASSPSETMRVSPAAAAAAAASAGA